MLTDAQIDGLIKAMEAGTISPEDRLLLLKEINSELEGMIEDVVALKREAGAAMN